MPTDDSDSAGAGQVTPTGRSLADVSIEFTRGWVVVFIAISFVFSLPLAVPQFLFELTGPLPLYTLSIESFPEVPFGVVFGTVTATGIYLSILVHELAHTIVAHIRDYTVETVTLSFNGGISKLTETITDGTDKFYIVSAGPASNVALGVTAFVCVLVASVVDFRVAMGVFHILFIANITMAGVNLVPMFPFDGGRLLHGLLTMYTNKQQATEYVIYSGTIVSGTFIGLAAYVLWNDVNSTYVPVGLIFVSLFLLQLTRDQQIRYRTNGEL